MSGVLPDPTSPFGRRVAERLRDDTLIWLTTVGPDGTPQPNPVWFLWDGQSILVYNKTGAKRLEHTQRNPRVSLNFEADQGGNDIVVFAGEVHLNPADPSPEKNAAYVEKYRDLIASSFQTPERFASLYPIPLRITITHVRGF